MSFYVTCKSTNDGSINAYVESFLNPKIKYEVGLVEFIYNNSWPAHFGKFNIYHNKRLIEEIEFEDYDNISIETFIFLIEQRFKSFELDVPLPFISYSYTKRMLSIFSRDKSIEFESNMFGDMEKFSQLSILNHAPLFRKTNFLNIFTDIISEQINGESKAHLLRTVGVEGYAFEWKIKDFDSIHYCDVQRTNFDFVYVNILNERNEKVLFSKPVSVKLHFRPKR